MQSIAVALLLVCSWRSDWRAAGKQARLIERRRPRAITAFPLSRRSRNARPDSVFGAEGRVVALGRFAAGAGRVPVRVLW